MIFEYRVGAVKNGLAWRLVGCLLASIPFLGLAFAQDQQSEFARLSGLRDAVRRGTLDAAGGVENLRRRAAALESFAIGHPELALQTVLTEAEANSVRQRIPAGRAFIEQYGDWTGELTTTIADDFDAKTSVRHRRFDIAGFEVQLAVAGGLAHARGQIHVRGARIGGVILADSQSIELLAPAAAASSCTTGSRSVLVVMVSFAGQALSSSVNSQTLAGYVFGSTGHSVNLYWQQASFGSTSASGIVFPSVVMMNSTITSGSQYSSIATQVRSSVTAAVYDSYSHHVMIIPKTADIGWAGLGDVGPCGSDVWVPDLYANSGDLTVGIIAHELGHNLGLEHASTQQYGAQTLGPPYDPANPTNQNTHVDYGDYTSVMGIAQGYLGHYAAPHKVQLGWMQSGTDVPAVQTAGTFTLLPYENTSGVRALKVSRGGLLNQWLWLQLRQNAGLDGTYTGQWVHAWDGVSMYLDDPTNWPGYTLLLDFTASGTPGTFTDAPLTAGTAWQDPYGPLTIRLNSASPAGANLTVQYDASCATLSPANPQFAAAGGSAQITVTAPSNCAWSANANVSWITLSGATTGTGNGTVSYTVGATGTSTSRSGSISVARQFFNLSQNVTKVPTATAIVSSQNPAAAGQSITWIASVSTSLATGTMRFLDGAGQLGSASLSAGTAQFSTASLSAGSHSITAQYGGDSNYATSSSTILNQSVTCAYSLSASSQSVPAGSTTTSAGVTTGAGCAWTAASNAAWLTVTAGASGSGAGTVSFSIAPNLSTSARSGTMSIAGLTYTVNQAGSAIASAPGVSSLSPSAASGSGQIFAIQFSNPAGYQALAVMNILVNETLDGRQACYLAYSLPLNTLYIVPDDGNGANIVGHLMNGSGTLANSQCSINLASSSTFGSGSTLTLTLAISFTPSFGGHKVVYAAAGDTASGTSGWQTMGVYGVSPLPAGVPWPVSLTPPSLSTSSAMVTATFRDAADANNLQTAWILVNSAIDGRNSCVVAYYRPGNQIYLYPDVGGPALATSTAFTGANSLSNSQCTVSALGGSVSLSGAQMTISMNITMNHSFAGAKAVWTAVQTLGGVANSPWQGMGSWVVP